MLTAFADEIPMSVGKIRMLDGLVSSHPGHCPHDPILKGSNGSRPANATATGRQTESERKNVYKKFPTHRDHSVYIERTFGRSRKTFLGINLLALFCKLDYFIAMKQNCLFIK